MDGAAEPQGGPANLTDLADRFGSDKGSAKHRYAELYHMLFQPLRDRPITFLEMGLLIGGPEHGASPDRETRDLPSIRMWLEFFPRAQVIGLDVSDFAWFEHPRFAFHRCDMDARANIAAAAAAMPAPDVVIDDASHASHHQQFAFLELFPRLSPGGLYIIEDLRWQPEAYERKGFTKTAALFRGFSERRTFIHGDPALQAEFEALAPQVSGCFLFQVRYDRTRRDQVAVIHKR
jgi:SAM-dependent methyltransferase